tara:strand:+ start:223 stop:1125 length:903 start_codon:yes stop_codon:yes gene_type:complete
MDVQKETMKKQSGFTLIELMVSLALGLGISWVMIDISLNAARSGQDIRSNGDVIEKGRYVSNLLKREIKHAGFFGRIVSANIESGSLSTNWCNSTPTVNQLKTPVFGLNNKSVLCNSINLLNGSDVLMIRRASTSITAPGALLTSRDYIQSNFEGITLAKGVASNFTLKELDGVTLAPSREYRQDLYYVDNKNNFKRRRLVNGSNIIEPLIEGVDDFQLEYGIDTNDDNLADTFVAAPAHNDYAKWQNIKSVTVFLLVSGYDTTQVDTKIYTYSSKSNVSFNDKKKRRLFSFTVAVGNQY